jgi:hypothetical protein
MKRIRTQKPRRQKAQAELIETNPHVWMYTPAWKVRKP